MAKPSLRQWPSAEQFCRARPVRAPKAEHWLSTWSSASKNVPATGTVRERIVFPLTFPLPTHPTPPRFDNGGEIR